MNFFVKLWVICRINMENMSVTSSFPFVCAQVSELASLIVLAVYKAYIREPFQPPVQPTFLNIPTELCGV